MLRVEDLSFAYGTIEGNIPFLRILVLLFKITSVFVLLVPLDVVNQALLKVLRWF